MADYCCWNHDCSPSVKLSAENVVEAENSPQKAEWCEPCLPCICENKPCNRECHSGEPSHNGVLCVRFIEGWLSSMLYQKALIKCNPMLLNSCFWNLRNIWNFILYLSLLLWQLPFSLSLKRVYLGCDHWDCVSVLNDKTQTPVGNIVNALQQHFHWELCAQLAFTRGVVVLLEPTQTTLHLFFFIFPTSEETEYSHFT